MSVLHKLVNMENNIDKLRELLRGGEDPNYQSAIDGSGFTPLHIAVIKSERNPQDTDDILLVVRELINFGANVDLGDYLGQTPLHCAVVCRNYKMIEMLLQAKAQINKRAAIGSAALNYATTRSKFFERRYYDAELGIVRLLLKYNPEVDIQNRYGKTPLMNAIRYNNIQIVQELLKNNASVNLQDSNGNSVMYYALNTKEVNVNIVLELMRHGCSFNIINDFVINFYVRKLVNAPRAEVEKAKYLLKLFVFARNYFNHHQLMSIIERSKEENREMSRFLEFCGNEIAQMRVDELVPNYSVYNIALRFVFCRVFKNPIPSQVVDKVLNKLIEKQYPIYWDILVSGICRPYMNEKFAEVCCYIEKTGRKFLNFDGLYSLSFYLSEIDMLNMMIACSE